MQFTARRSLRIFLNFLGRLQSSGLGRSTPGKGLELLQRLGTQSLNLVCLGKPEAIWLEDERLKKKLKNKKQRTGKGEFKRLLEPPEALSGGMNIF